jgi:hypothetical protein
MAAAPQRHPHPASERGRVTRGMVAWALATLDIAGYTLLAAIGLATSVPGEGDPVTTTLFGAAVVAFSIPGALLVARAPANRVGALLLATGTAQAAGIGVLMYAGLGNAAVPPWPGASLVGAVGELAYLAPFAIALVAVPLVFPDGRLPSRRFRWVVASLGIGMALLVATGLVPLVPGVAEPDALAGALNVAALAAIIFAFGGAATAVATRFRRGSPVQRQQVKWLLAVASVAATVFPMALILGSSENPVAIAMWLIGFLAYLALPVAVAIAVLRYHLYDINRIISRSIAYLILTGVLILTFAVGLLLLQELLDPLTAGNTVAVAASTLISAALFQPLRGRVQAIVDRRFNRARYDAEQTVAAFSVRLREDIDLDRLSGDVRAAVAQTVAPVSTGFWLRAPVGADHSGVSRAI